MLVVFKGLEPCAVKVACTVLRGQGACKSSLLPDYTNACSRTRQSRAAALGVEAVESPYFPLNLIAEPKKRDLYTQIHSLCGPSECDGSDPLSRPTSSGHLRTCPSLLDREPVRPVHFLSPIEQR